MAFVYKNNPLAPGTYTISSKFGYRSSISTSKGNTSSSHKGIDLATYGGSSDPIYAVADGVVSKIAYDDDGYGHYIVLEHSDEVETLYAHMAEQSPLSEGSSVSAGMVIGNVGSTGSSTGPHLHFEIVIKGKRVDPAPYIESGGTTVVSEDYTEDDSAGDITSSNYVVEAGGTTIGQRVSGTTTQPVHAFINIYYGDNQTLLATTPAKPNMIQSFEYSRLDGAGETVIFSIFDDNWEEIESILSAHYDKIFIQYGYYGTGLKSKLYKVLLLDYSISFHSTGTIISVEAVSEGVVSNLNPVTMALNTYNPTEAVKTICRELGYKVLDENFDSSKDIVADNPFNIIEENPISYIQYTIIPQAAEEGEELFSFDIDPDGTVYFKRESYDSTNVDNLRTYIYQKGYDSNVIDFHVDVKGIFGGSGTFNLATEYRSSVFDTKTKESQSYSANKSSVVTVATGDSSFTRSDQSASLLDSAGYSPSQMKNQLYYRMKSMTNDAYGATLTIVGDPSINVHEFVRLINVTDKGHLHHTSGVYWIEGVTDSIHAGEMITVLKLIKNATAGDIDGLEIINPKLMIK